MLFAVMVLAREVEAKNFVLLYRAPGKKGASGATSYLPSKGGSAYEAFTFGVGGSRTDGGDGS